MALELYDGNGDPFAAPIAFTASGAPSSEATVQVFNDKDLAGASPEINLSFRVQARDSGGSTWLSSGHPVLDELMVEARIEAGLGGKTVVPTDWVALGALALPDLTSGEGVDVRVRINPPANTDDAVDVELLFQVRNRESNPAGPGLIQAGLQGISDGLGDFGFSRIVRLPEIVTSGTDTVTVTVPGYVHQGEPNAVIAEDVQLDGNDGDAVAIGAGESYIGLITVGASGLTLTKGSKGTPGLEPTAPAGELLVYAVTRDDTGTIGPAEVTNRFDLGAYEVLDITNLTITLGGDTALAGDRIIPHHGPRVVTAGASLTDVGLYLLPSGNLSVAATPPVRGALLLYRLDTDATDVTATRDRRRRLSGVVAELAIPGTLSVSSEVYFHAERLTRLDPARPVSLSVGDLPNDNTAGSLIVELERWDGVAWVTLFTSSGTDDRRPQLAFDATDFYAASAAPEILSLTPGDRLRARVTAIPSGGTAPADLHLRLHGR